MPPREAPQHGPQPPAAHLDHVTVRLDGATVLEDISFTVEAGDFLGIVGPNGAGKSTLLRTMLGLQAPTRGDVRLLGVAPQRFDAWPRVGYVPQHAVNVDRRFPASAMEVALLGRVGRRGLLRRWNDEDRAAAREALDLVGVEHLAQRQVGKLSGGERQRVFLAKALASDPDVLILDEPTAGVDVRSREAFYNLVDGLNHEHGLSVLLVSHDVHAVEACCHHLIALNRRIVYDGDPQGFEEAGGMSKVHDMHIHHHEEGA